MARWDCFLFSSKESCIMFWPPESVCSFGGFFVWEVSRLAGGRQMSPKFRKVHLLTLLPITDRFLKHHYCLRCLSVWCRFVSDDLWNEVVCFQKPSLLIRKVTVLVMRFCVSPIHCKVQCRVGRRPLLWRFNSVYPLIGSTFKEF